MTTKTLPNLSHFTGSCRFERWSILFRDVITEGVKFMAESVGAFWLLDIIGSYQPKLQRADFQVWKIVVDGSNAIVTMQEDSDLKPMVTQRIGYTDFPQGEFKLWAVRNEMGHMTIMLPSEY